MSGNLAVNDATGEALFFDGSAWKPAQITQNDAGVKMAFDGQSWQPISNPGATKLYSPNPDAPKSYGGADFSTVTPEHQVERVIGQGAQKFNDAVTDAALALPDASAWVSRKTGLVPEDTPRPSDVAKQGIDYVATLPGRTADAIAQKSTSPLFDKRTSRFEPTTDAERIAGDVGGGAGQVFGSLIPLSLMSKYLGSVMPRTAQVATSLAQNPGQQAASMIAGNVVGDVTGDPRIGMATSLATPFALNAANRVAHAAPAVTTQEAERRDLLKLGQQIGAPNTAGKILGSKGLQTVESAASNMPLPVIGGQVAKTEEANRNAWQKAILEKAGVSGETAATPSVVENVIDNAGNKIETAISGQTVKVDKQFGSDLDKIEKEYGKQLLSTIQPGIMDRIRELRSAASTLGQSGVSSVAVKGDTFQNIRSKLSKLSSSATDPQVRQAAGGMVGALDDLAERSLPANVVQDYKEGRRLYRNAVTLRDAMKSANNDSTAVGNIPTAAFNRLARNNPDLQKLGQYGTAMVGDKAANTSRTASHNVANHMMEAGGLYGAYEGLHHLGLDPLHAGLAIGSLALPPLLERGLNNPATRALLLKRYENVAPSMLTKQLFGALAGQEALKQTR